MELELLIVLLVVERTQSVSQYEIGHIVAERVAEDARSAEMDATEYTRISDFCNGAGET